MLALGLDFGTTSLSAVAVRSDGSLARHLTRDHHADIRDLPDGSAEQSPRQLLETAIELIAELVTGLSESIACLGLTGQMHGLILADAALNPVSNLVTWQDRRSLAPAGKESVDADSWLVQFQKACDPEAMVRTGCTPAAGYLGVTLYTLQERGEIPASTSHALIFADWVAAALTGARPVTDRTNAASTGLFDLARNCWSDIVQQTGLPTALLPPVVESGDPLGGLRPEFAARMRLPSGLPVCVAIGDHQAAVLGSLPPEESSLHLNVGTGGQVSIPLAVFERTHGSETRYLPEQRYLRVGAGFAGGNALAWVQRTVANWRGGDAARPTAAPLELAESSRAELPSAESSRAELPSAPDQWYREKLYRELLQQATQVPPGCDGLRCEPFFHGTRQEPHRRGQFSGVAPHNFTPGHLFRATAEGLARAFAEFVSRQAALGTMAAASFDRVIATGNAVRRNPLLALSLEQAFGVPLFVPVPEEEAAYGAAILAGTRCSMWSNLNHAARGFSLRPGNPTADIK